MAQKTEYIYLVLENDTTQRLKFQFVPQGVQVIRNTSTQAVQIVGRNNPNYQYTAGDTMLVFKLDFYAMDRNRAFVIDRCRWLESLTYNNGSQEPTDRVILLWGKMFQNEVWVVQAVNYSLSNFSGEEGLYPLQAYVDLTLVIDNTNDINKQDLRKGNING